MQTYNSTRQVQAAKIGTITPHGDTGSTNLDFEGERQALNRTSGAAPVAPD